MLVAPHCLQGNQQGPSLLKLSSPSLVTESVRALGCGLPGNLGGMFCAVGQSVVCWIDFGTSPFSMLLLASSTLEAGFGKGMSFDYCSGTQLRGRRANGSTGHKNFLLAANGADKSLLGPSVGWWAPRMSEFMFTYDIRPCCHGGSLPSPPL